jgi:16S rRNA (guanine966-N2)-methyltransferase
MQIITGKYRARKLVGVDSTDTRPTLARVKESVFNLIFDKIEGKVVLDLFAGSGAYGAECISRGAKEVFFVDQTEKAIKTIKTNTQKMTEKFEIIKSSFKDALVSFENRKIKFDLVFLDPPYDSDFAFKSLEILKKKQLLNDGATIVVEHKLANDLQNLPECYIIKKSRKYGIAYIDILEFTE